jgi:hypothetical protein
MACQGCAARRAWIAAVLAAARKQARQLLQQAGK